MIPKLIHRVWLSADTPSEVVDFGRAWERLHPGWTVVLWRDWTLPALVNQRAFDASPSAAQKADIVRFELLARFGGVYVDTDMEPRKALDELLSDLRCAFAREDDRWVGTAFVAAIPMHPFVVHVRDRLGAQVEEAAAGTPTNEVTGPKVVTAALQAWLTGGGEDVTVFPPSLFYPYHFSEPHRRGEAFPDAYTIHHWAGSWLERAGSSASSGSASTD